MKTEPRTLPARASLWLAAAAALTLVLSAVHAPAAPQPAAETRIDIKNHKYSAPTLTVPVGATVTWVNHDDDVHTVVSTTALFRSAGLDADDSFSYRFTKPGTYPYFCTLHPLMVGQVIVR